MATIIAVGTPRNDSERMAIAYLRDHLPVNYTVIHNFELMQGNETFEIDLLVLAPHCVYLVDVKGVRGLVDIQGGTWYPSGRSPYGSPLARARLHAKLLKALLVDTYRAYPQMERMYVRAAVLLTAPDVQIHDSTGNDINDCVRLNKCVPYFQSKTNVPAGLSTDITPLLSMIQKTIVGKARAAQTRIYREWSVEEKLGGNEHYTEYRARHLYGKHGTARLRIYRADPYQDEVARKREQKIISNAYRAVGNMPGHPNILNVRDFFPAEDDSYFVLVTEDAQGQALRQHIKKASLALTFDQKVRVMRDVLSALEHAHSHQVVHRNLTPDTIFVGNDGHARLFSFEYARLSVSGTSSIGPDIVEAVDQTYQAPECYGDPSQATAASDLFSVGLVFYELLTGENAFNGITQIYDTGAIFPVRPTDIKPDLPSGLNEWLQKLCAFQSSARFPDAATALVALNRILLPARGTQAAPAADTVAKRISSSPPSLDKQNLPREYILDDRFVVQERLGQGGFAVAYRVLDMMSEVMRVLKLVLKDSISITQRLRQEYKTLSAIPEHPYVVKTIWADKLADGTPYIMFEYVDGLNVEDLVREKALTLEDAVKLAMQVTDGLAFLHEHGVYHQDIKPSNLLWTDTGVRIIDFNVAIYEQASTNMPGGTGRYIPPDLQNVADLSMAQKIERDVYALGVTLYECITGHYPFDEASIRKHPADPYVYEPDLHPNFAALLLKAISPDTSQRFSSATELQNALNALVSLRVLIAPPVPSPSLSAETRERPNYNPYVQYLLTLYSQSQYTNAGTRGLDDSGEQTYVETLLDMQLRPAILRGDFQLVIISGNAGDGKTAFIQQLAKDAQDLGVDLQHQANGYTFTLQGRAFVSNYDGSQDEGETTNDDVLLAFFAPFKGRDETAWTQHETRLIAINEGRLVDFLTEHEQTFPRLTELVRDGLNGLATQNKVTVVNLNLRAVIADTPDASGREQERSIFDHQLRRMTEKQFWSACEQCDLKQRCYIYHNARTFMDPVAGTRTIERLKTLYTMTHLRGQLHITIRDLRSALAYMLVGTRDCDAVHTLYTEGTDEAAQQILDAYYFNAWMGGTTPSKDRLITLLRQIDIGEVSNPELDRTFDFLQPSSRDMGRFTYTERSNYDDELLTKSFQVLPRDFTEKTRMRNIERHRAYVAMLRRRHYFECRNESWEEMVPYHHYKPFFKLVAQSLDAGNMVQQVYTLLEAINRGEGLIDATHLTDVLALRVRLVERGTIRSYRLFNGEFFNLTRRETRESTRFIEHLPQSLYLSYTSDTGHTAELRINLDIYEMLMRLNDGYRPSQEELQGFYLSLIVFKNVLSSAPYQEVLLTETGHEFYRISRSSDGKLTMKQLTQP